DERGAGTPYTKAAGSSTPAPSTEPGTARNPSNTTSKRSEVIMRKMQLSPRYIVLVCVFLLSSCLLAVGNVAGKRAQSSSQSSVPAQLAIEAYERGLRGVGQILQRSGQPIAGLANPAVA